MTAAAVSRIMKMLIVFLSSSFGVQGEGVIEGEGAGMVVVDTLSSVSSDTIHKQKRYIQPLCTYT